MLGGIVTMQVSLLKLNAGISKNVETAGTLERVNADLETEVAKLSSGERIQQTAIEEGMVTPAAGDVGYLRARPGADPRLAAQRMQKPSAEAEEVMANGGHALAPVVPVTATTAPAAVATPAATAVPPAPTPTPSPTVDPAATSSGG
jgi:cell division protein FtsL